MTSKQKAKDNRLRSIYNSSLEEFNAKLKEQNFGCAICNRPFPKFIANQDHAHRCCPRKLKKFCGKCNRGLLCWLCNKFIAGVLEKLNAREEHCTINALVNNMAAYFNKWDAILKERGAYDPKPETKQVKTRKSRAKQTSVR